MAEIIHPKQWRKEGNKHWVPQESSFFPRTEPPDWPGKSEAYDVRKGKARLKRKIVQHLYGDKLPQDLNCYTIDEWGLLWDKWGLYVSEWARLTKANPKMINFVSSIRLERLSRKVLRLGPSNVKQTTKPVNPSPSNTDQTGKTQRNLSEMKRRLLPMLRRRLEKRLLAKLEEMRNQAKKNGPAS